MYFYLAQCAVCTKSAIQLGRGPAQGMNWAIIYLALIPLVIIGLMYWRWRKQN